MRQKCIVAMIKKAKQKKNGWEEETPEGTQVLNKAK